MINKKGIFLMAVVAPVLAVSSSAFADAPPPPRIVTLDPNTPAQEVNRYFSMHAHGPTKKFYRLPEAGIVVVVQTHDIKPEASATIHVFSHATAPEAIDKWVNNQHSDALFIDAAVPERSIVVPADRFHGKVSEPLEHTVGGNGDEYDRVEMVFTIDPFEDGDVTVRESRGKLQAFLRTKDLPSPSQNNSTR